MILNKLSTIDQLQLEMQTGKWLYGQGNEKEATDLLVRALSPARFNLCQVCLR